MKKTSTFKKQSSDKIYHILKPLNCNSKNTVYLIECNQCWKQYTGSSKTKFCYRADIYKTTHGIDLRTKNKFPKKLSNKKIFHKHFCSDDHIDQTS